MKQKRNQNNSQGLTYHTIKFLKGYGFSIRQHQNKITLTDGKDPFTNTKESESFHLTEFPYEKIVYSGDGYVSTKAVHLLIGAIVTTVLGLLLHFIKKHPKVEKRHEMLFF